MPASSPPRPKLTSIAALLLAFFAGGRSVQAHVPQYGIGTLSTITFRGDKILITFDLSYTGMWALGEMITMDRDKNHIVDDREADLYVQRKWDDSIRRRIHAKLDGKVVTPLKTGQRHERLPGEILDVPFSLYYDLELDLSDGEQKEGKVHRFEFGDFVLRDETKVLPLFHLPQTVDDKEEARDTRLRLQVIEPTPPGLQEKDSLLPGMVEGRRLVVQFLLGPGGDSLEKEYEQALQEAMKERAQESPQGEDLEGQDSNVLLKTVEEDFRNLSWIAILGSILLVTLYGAGHALAPGHGKAMVAAYLIGTRGRIRDAVILGLMTTITHTGSVFVFGLTIFFMVSASARYSQGALSNRVIVGTQLISGLLLLLLGLIIFYRRWRGKENGHDHHHDHDHDHHHHHSHDHKPPEGLLKGGTPRLRDLIALGFSGGLVPCPAGLVVILLGLRYPDKLFFTLCLLVFFSLGLGSVLVAIGVFLVAGKALARRRARGDGFFRESRFLRRIFPLTFLAFLDQSGLRLLKVLPALSGLFIASLGAFFVVSTFLTGRTQIAAMLRGLADWLQ